MTMLFVANHPSTALLGHHGADHVHDLEGAVVDGFEGKRVARAELRLVAIWTSHQHRNATRNSNTNLIGPDMRWR